MKVKENCGILIPNAEKMLYVAKKCVKNGLQINIILNISFCKVDMGTIGLKDGESQSEPKISQFVGNSHACLWRVLLS